MKNFARRSVALILSLILCLMSLSLVFAVTDEDDPYKWDGSQVTIGEISEDRTVINLNRASDLAWFATLVNNGNNLNGVTVNLMCDIDLDNKPWEPIGKTGSTAFKGTFNGNGHSISNVYVNVSIDSFNILNAPYHTIGLFGYCSNATVRNLVIDGTYLVIENSSGYSNDYSSINGAAVYAGAVCGYAKSTVFEGIDVSDAFVDAYTGPEAGGAYAGGICGYNDNGFRFSFCGIEYGLVRSKSDSLANNSYAGGIVGYAANEGVINQCFNGGSVVGGHSMAETCTGGILGKSYSSADTLSSVVDCYNTGNIYHEGSFMETGGLGGIAGYSYSTVSRCYNAGALVASTNTYGESYCVGGIAGKGSSSSSVSDCAVMSSQITGGTKNYAISAYGIKSGNAALSSITGSPVNDANFKYASSVFYDESLYKTTLGWDFSNVWKFVSGEYPKLYRMDETTGEDINTVLDCLSKLAIVFAEGDYYDHVTQNVGLPRTVSYEASESTLLFKDVLWESSNNDIVDDVSGKVVAKKNDCIVKMVATITSGTYSASKTFVLNVVGEDGDDLTEGAYWGMSVDDARTLMALVRGCRFKDVAADDSDVLVLTGADTNEQHVINTVSKIIEFWDVPSESAYLRSQMGDVVTMIKNGANSEINSLVSSLSDGLVKYDDKNDEGVINEANVASKLISIPNATLNVKINVVNAYKAITGLNGMSFDPDKDFVDQFLNTGKKIFTLTDLMFKSAGKNVNLGKWSTNIKNTYDLWQLSRAYEVAKKNAVKNYLKNYINNRAHFSDKDDPTFQLIMAAHVVTSMRADIDNIEEVAESIYLMTEKFCRGLDDEYKIVIKCPVDVSIYDRDGNIVGRVINNIVDKSIVNSLKVEVGGINGDEKTIYIEDDEEYTVVLVGNDAGEMDINVGRINSNNSIDNSFESIPLEVGKKMITTISSEDVENNNVNNIEIVVDGVVTEEYESVDSTELKYLFDVTDVTASLDGTISVSDEGGSTADGYFVEKADLRGLSTANYGYVFDGYYSDIDCQNRVVISSMLAENTFVYAKFTEINPEIEILKQPVGGNYRQHENIDALTVEVNVPSKYSVSYQWYMIDEDGKEISIENATQPSCIPSSEICGTFRYFVRITAVDGTTVLTSQSETVFVNVSEHIIVDGGVCGETLSWQYFENGELVIDGFGGMQTMASESEVPWKDYVSEIKKVVFKGEITSVSSFAFAGMTSLTELVIPDSVTYIGENALKGCTSLKTLSIPFVGASRTADKTDSAVLGHIFGKVSNASNGVVQYYKLEGTTLKGYKYGVPASLDEVVVTDADILPFGSFANCSGITKITVNEGISKVSEYSFYNCTSLKSFTVPESVVTIEECALSGCSSLEELVIPFVGSSQDSDGTTDAVLGHIFGRTNSGIQQYFLLDSGSLYSCGYDIPQSLCKVTVTNDKIIAVGAFSNCVNLKEIKLCEPTEKINEFAFYGIRSIDKLYVLSKTCDFVDNYNSVSISGTIYGYNGSAAQRFANRKSIAFVIIDEVHEHNFTGWTVTESSTCTESGTEIGTCECGETETRPTDSLGHDYSESWTVDKEATCKENGSKSRHCSRCSSKIDVTETEKLEHNFTGWTVTESPTCTESGTEIGTCECGETETRQTDSLGHDYSESWTVDKEATCKENGSKSRHCSRCSSKIDVAETEKLEHEKGEWIYVEASETEGAKYVKFCLKCNEIAEEKYIDYVAVESVSLSDSFKELYEGESVVLYATVLPENASDKNVEWISEDSTTVSVDSNGVVTAIKPGTVTITAKTSDGGYIASCEVKVLAKEYVVTWKVDESETKVAVARGSVIDLPPEPVKEGYIFKGWTPEVPAEMPGYDITFIAVFEKATQEPIEPDPITSKVAIRGNSGFRKINYGETLRLTAIVTDKAENIRIFWYINGEKAGEGEKFDVSFESGSKNISVKLVDESGNPINGADGNEISDSQEVTVKSGFFQKIISFFKNLFRINRIVEQ